MDLIRKKSVKVTEVEKKRYDGIYKQIQTIISNLNDISSTNNSHKFNLMMIQHLNYAPEMYTKMLINEEKQQLKTNLNSDKFIRQLCKAVDRD